MEDNKKLDYSEYYLANMCKDSSEYRAKITEQIKQQARAEVIEEITIRLIKLQQEIFNRDKDNLVAFADLYSLLDEFKTKLSENTK